MPDLRGRTLGGRYRIEELIGRGGMAEVYKAWDSERNYYVAAKVLREDLAEDREFDRRFRREAEALARLAHKNIVRFYGFEREGHLAFIVMDFVEGTTLRRRIFDADGPLPTDEVLSIVEQVASALHYAHAQGVLHRDVKPGNIMIQPDGRALLSDFGIAKAADAATMTTVMPGTPAYMSPEQCRSEPLDVRTDVYSLGIVVYEMLAGRRPFVGDTTDTGTGSTGERIRWEQMHATPSPPRRYNLLLPHGVNEVVLEALAKEREQRWPTALAFWQALEGALGAAEPVMKSAPMPEPAITAPAAEAVKRIRPEPSPAPPVRPAERAVPAAVPTALRVPGWAWALLVVFALVVGLVMAGASPTATPTPEVVDVDRVVTATPMLTDTPRPPTVTPTPTPTPEAVEVGRVVTATPVPTVTPRPSTATPVPIATPCPPTTTSLPTVTPRPPTTTPPTPSCPNVSGPFAGTWSMVQDRIGCTTGSHSATWVAEEAFENGRMYWRKDNNTIYAVYNRGGWEAYPTTWHEGDPYFSCPDADTPNESPPTPVMGFGKVWCTQLSVRQSLGWATEAEHGSDATVQHFEHGFMLRTDRWTWIFYNDGSWER